MVLKSEFSPVAEGGHINAEVSAPAAFILMSVGLSLPAWTFLVV